MNTKRLMSIVALLVVAATVIGIVGCGNTNSSTRVYNNETDPLVFSTLEVDQVFNPFFSTSGTDSNIVGMTQIGMIGNDKDGNPTYGDNHAVVAKDLQIVTVGTPNVDQTTTYYFVMKNNVKYSNGSPLTMKDVLFNLYVYLDPSYTGSSTIYSTDIVGLQAYRTQSGSQEEQDNYNKRFEVAAQTRIQDLISAAEEIAEEYDYLTHEIFEAALAERYNPDGDNNAHLLEDYAKMKEFFRKELETDFSNSMNSYEDQKFVDAEGNVYSNLFTTDVEMFLYNEGYITWSKKNAELTYATGSDIKDWTKEMAIEWVYEANVPTETINILTGWMTATELYNYLVLAEREAANVGNGGNLMFPNISGIKFANRLEPVTVNGVTYGVPTYNADGSVATGNEVLSITINGVDPKAIWNFGFAIAPMYYYSNAEQINLFDYENHFGVKYDNISFMNNVVKNPDKIGVPVGAGPYAASKASGGLSGVSASDFYSYGIIYFERNPHFVMGPAAIKMIRYQVVSNTQMLNSLYAGRIDWAEPNAKPETIKELNGKKNEGIGNKSVQTLGYGYIGINAGKVPSMAVRQAIMHSIDTQLCVDYYKTTASAIYRPMSLSNWAYPQGATPYYPYIGGPVPADLSVVNPAYRDFCVSKGKRAGDKFTVAEQREFIKSLVEGAGYTINSNGVYANASGNILKYDFTVAGEDTDHPAWIAMYSAGQFLNGIGFQITTKTDSNALKKLSSGDLAVWAAAWGSTIDPDMYQVYHIDSKATSTLNWGYAQIKANPEKYAQEYALVKQLATKIEQARKTNDQSVRAELYSDAMDIVMQLAIELPTYQRDDLFAFNTWKINVATLTPNNQLSSYYGLLSEIHKVSLNTER